MQIQIKQTEIIAAIKGYISNQGISLKGKDVTITFTAGRKETGLTADISIDDARQDISKFYVEKEAIPEGLIKREVVESPVPMTETTQAEESATEAPKAPSLFS